MISDVDKYARTLWDYLLLHQEPQKSDAIFCLCSIDERVAVRAAELFTSGLGDYLVFSGGVAHTDDMLKTSWDGPEAEHFAKIARRKGVPKESIIVENKAQNTGENIRFTKNILDSRGLNPKSLILVQKPYGERRTYATFKKQWPDNSTKIIVTSPKISYDEYFNSSNPKELVIHIMVGDLQRIKEYPKLGFQIEQAIPTKVWDAYQQLIKLGFDKHLLKN